MTREELVEKMLDAFDKERMGLFGDFNGAARRQCFAAALDAAVGELLGEPTFDDMFWVIEPDKGCRNLDAATYGKCCQVLASRRSRYLPKSDPAVEAVKKIVDEVNRRRGLRYDDYAERIVAAVRKADAK